MKDRIYFNNGWEFSPSFNEKMLDSKYKGKFEQVRIPHSVCETPFNGFDESEYQKLSIYRKFFKTEKEWAGKKILLTIEGAAHQCDVFLNGKFLARHSCGYTAFTVDLTDSLLPAGRNNLLALKLDSRESLNIPPFGFVIDYMTYGGIYRDVYLDIKNPIYIEDIFIKTKASHFETEITLNSSDAEGYSIVQRVESSSSVVAQINTGVPGNKILTAADAQPVHPWTLEQPVLYNLVTELINPKGKIADKKNVRFGFREIKFDETGFYLNGKKIKLRGLNRHQSYPYVGYAMPKNIQKEDADILKLELGVNYVRTSHYPQSKYFIERCDELGILVFTEFPGWQHIGDDAWKAQALENEDEMISQYRNHPSVFMWGVRINESKDDDEFYKATNFLAHKTDSTRPTGGVRCIKNSNLLEDVYTYNDFSHSGKNAGSLDKIKVTKSHGGYLVTEHSGHMFPTKSFDTEQRRTEHAIRHATVLDSVAEHDDCAGSSGWCAFDYNTHKEFGSGDRICYHGVMDMFRNPKLAAAVYKSQEDFTGDFIEVNSNMSIGEYNEGLLGDLWIFTNADSVKFFVNNTFIKEFKAFDSPFKNLAHGPILVDDIIGNRLIDEEGISAKNSEKIKELIFAIKKFGQNSLPAKYKLEAAKLFAMRVISKEKLIALFGKYISNWGGESSSYKFEAIKNGKTVKTLVKSMCKNASLKTQVSRTILTEEETYDVAEVHLRAEDENGNLQSFMQEAVLAEAEGAIEIIGPQAVSLKGGMSGIYVKTTGTAGRGTLKITDWQGKETKISFTVKIKR